MAEAFREVGWMVHTSDGGYISSHYIVKISRIKQENDSGRWYFNITLFNGQVDRSYTHRFKITAWWVKWQSLRHMIGRHEL